MRQFIVTHGYIVDVNAEGNPHLNSRVFAAVDKADTDASGARYLAAQASLTVELLAALKAIFLNTEPGAITIAAHSAPYDAALAAIARAEGL